ncbi:PREDICTED: IQ and ubiquitin-like domain-containing protein [Chinchilla lanigera]|uniref:IQ motif and ubiquitin domain containing n=1 Tax=Chinchilla lanigera TaxID=34839 RepID=A0A8C2V315_CHILA|nr:PREDICTED: IQ and ubiquitin-like domain-containing protein [Chinchilla lanigera]
MSDQDEQLDIRDIVDSTEGSENAVDIINIPLPSEALEESEPTEENISEVEQFSMGPETPEEQSDQSVTNEESSEEQLLEEALSSRQASGSVSPKEEQHSVESDKENLSNESLAFLDKIRALRQSLQISIKDPSATVKIVLIPVGQEIIMSFKVDTFFKYLVDHIARLLGIPPSELQISHAGKILKNNETLIQHGIKPQQSVQVEISSLNPDLYPIKRIATLNDVSHIITVIIQTGIDQFQEVAVEIVQSDFHKPFLGGFRHKVTGIEYHNAGTQTVPKKIPEKFNVFCRDTQTVLQRKKIQQTTNTTSTQMTKIGVYVSNMTDKLVTPGKYFSAAEYHAQRLKAVIVIQTYYRRWHAKVFTEDLRRQKMLRLEWEAEEELRKVKEKEEWMQLDYYRRHNPKTSEDFELLYNALELWRQEELTRINQCLTGAERKAALCELLEKETQIIASIGRHRYIACTENQEEVIQAFMDKCSSPKVWRRSDGKIVEMATQFTVRARELQNIYKCIKLQNISQDERLDILLTLKHTVKEHECELTQEILELIDREVDLMMRGVKPENLEGLRKRIATLFFHYIKTPLFNPEAARYLKVPQDPLKFYKKIYFCRSCQLYLPSTEFAVTSTARHIFKCRQCVSLENEAQRRESFLKYKCLLQRLYASEANYDDGAQIAFLMQLQDIQYLIENIWAPQSALSAWTDLNDLVMVRWDKSVEWSPWNCILLTKDEAAAHLKLESIEKGYGRVFIHRIKHKHILAKNYFSQIPVLASFILDDGEIEEIRSKYHVDTAPKIIEVRRPCP